ncbi:MAG: glycoside hydrolase/deacetylase [Paenibacillus sp.]|nr:glycoside hydrolase/deacetylase [Paenibacillus sp.]
MKMKMAKVVLFCDALMARRKYSYGLNVFEKYVGEILSEAGIPHTWIDRLDALADAQADIAIVVLEDDMKDTADRLMQLAEQGMTVITYGGLPKLAASLGCRQLPAASVGYATVPGGQAGSVPLRTLHIAPWETIEPQAEQQAQTAAIPSGSVRYHTISGEASCAALQRFTVGSGSIERWAVNIPATIVAMQQGTSPVLTDGIPAPDGSAKLDEFILKADDRVALDWELDRTKTETGQSYFAHPYADLWREALIGHLLQAAASKRLTLPFRGRWPEGIQNVAMISHDSDGNKDEHAESTLRILAQCEVNSSWCMLEPGYSAPIYEKVRAAGHELAFHYNSVVHEKKEWSEESFDRQHQWFKDATGESAAVSNKNHYTRFEGWGELFAWCEKNGIASDQTRGSSKPGNVGFLFGTCMPYFPIAWSDEQNRMYDVVELGFLTQDMDLQAWADRSVITPFLEKVQSVNGVAHFLFHQVHIHNKEEVRQAFIALVDTARKLGFTFWTGKQINDWVRACRKANITGIDSAGQVVLEGQVPEGLVVYVPVAEGETHDGNVVTQYGITCRKVKG